MLTDYEEFRKRLLQQDLWQILGKWTGLGATGVGILLILLSPLFPDLLNVFYCILGTCIVAVIAIYSMLRMQEAGKDSTTALRRFLTSVGTKY